MTDSGVGSSVRLRTTAIAAASSRAAVKTAARVILGARRRILHNLVDQLSAEQQTQLDQIAETLLRPSPTTARTWPGSAASASAPAARPARSTKDAAPGPRPPDPPDMAALVQ